MFMKKSYAGSGNFRPLGNRHSMRSLLIRSIIDGRSSTAISYNYPRGLWRIMLIIKKCSSKNSRYFVLLLLVFLAFLFGARASFAGEQAVIRYQFTYLSPAPGASFVPAESTITIRPAGGNGRSLSRQIVFQVHGSISGSHDGRILIGADGQTIVFRPDRSFYPAEEVRVAITSPFAGGGRSTESHYSFQVASPKEEAAHVWPDDDASFASGPDFRAAAATCLPISTTRKKLLPRQIYLFSRSRRGTAG